MCIAAAAAAAAALVKSITVYDAYHAPDIGSNCHLLEPTLAVWQIKRVFLYT